MGRRVRIKKPFIRSVLMLILAVGILACIISCEDMALLQVIRERIELETWTMAQSGSAETAGSSITYTNNKEEFSFKLKACPGKTFPTGIDDLSGDAAVSSFWIGETEVSYELWYAVRDWAENIANPPYTFANVGREGNDGGLGDSPNNVAPKPVTAVSWRDAITWCNALTEYYNFSIDPDLSCVYYTDSGYTKPIRSIIDTTVIDYPNPGSQDDPYVKTDADGFRLPLSYEWELAARFIQDINTDGDITDAGEFYPGNHASGDMTSYCFPSDAGASTVFGDYAWYGSNSSDTTHIVGTAGNNGGDVLSGNANALGLYDMSGNAWEWCFDWDPDWEGIYRVTRGGDWYLDAEFLQIGFVGSYYPYYKDDGKGFRLTRRP